MARDLDRHIDDRRRLDQSHPDHKTASQALFTVLMEDDVAVSVVTLAELAVGGRTREALEADLKGMMVIEVTAADAWRAGQVFARLPRKHATPLPDFFIRAKAAERGWRHLTNDRRRLDRRRLGWWPDLEFVFGN